MRIFLFSIFFLNFSLMYSQPLSPAENSEAHRRYWYYRTRFINDFVKIGGNQGDCICFAERNYEWTSLNESKVGPDQMDIMNQYLHALALEYKLLSRNHQSTNETLKEIFYILKMYGRLDEEADRFWSQNINNDHLQACNGCDLNGFMLREDMPHDYFKPDQGNPGYIATAQENFLHFNYALKEYTTNPQEISTGYAGLHKTDGLTKDNKFSNYVGFTPAIPGYTPQPLSDISCVHDKYYSMFIAFMQLIKYIPDNTGYVENNNLQTFQDGAWDIKTEVRNITNRCHPYIRGNVSDWVLKYPDGNSLAIGSAMWPYSYPMAKIICYINSGYPWPWPCNSYQDGFSLSTGFLTYNALYLNPIPPTSPLFSSEDAAVFLGNCMAGSNAPVFPPNIPIPIPIPTGVAMDLNTSINNIEWADLVRKVLHQSGPFLKQKSVYADPINVAPCKGPYNFSDDNPGFEWRSQDRLEHPKARINGGPPANYPGVDYMLLHNLYYEYINQLDDVDQNQTAAYKNAYNLMDNYDERIYPWHFSPPHHGGPLSPFNNGSDYTFGVNANINTNTVIPGQGHIYVIAQPAYIKLFQNLDSRAQIYASASPLAPTNTISSKVEYRAGKEITLLPEGNGKPGFEVRAGSDFHAYIARYICSGNSDQLLLRQNPNGQPSYSNDYLSDTMNTEIPIHYVKGQPSDSDLFPYENPEQPNLYLNEQEALQQMLLDQKLAENGIYSSRTELNQRFMVNPNPNNGVFSVYANRISEDEIFTLSVVDMKGIELMRFENIESNINQLLDITKYGPGIYLIKLRSSKGFNSTKKISVN